MLQVYLVRHGETQWNAERRIQGQSDSPLTAKGEQQAMQADDPALTVRWAELDASTQASYPQENLRQPVRIVIDSQNRVTP
ncbi:histidine phosphatase family protein, partial [Salmonella enterica subsp. enterica serovar Montevideo]|nr:histidine phosphatase family protein [Salmonella enterica subsp. enterica serovar Montevideo]